MVLKLDDHADPEDPSTHWQLASATEQYAPIQAYELAPPQDQPAAKLFMKAIISLFFAALWTVTRSPPRAWHSARTAGHVPQVVRLYSVSTHPVGIRTCLLIGVPLLIASIAAYDTRTAVTRTYALHSTHNTHAMHETCTHLHVHMRMYACKADVYMHAHPASIFVQSPLHING